MSIPCRKRDENWSKLRKGAFSGNPKALNVPPHFDDVLEQIYDKNKAKNQSLATVNQRLAFLNSTGIGGDSPYDRKESTTHNQDKISRLRLKNIHF